MGEFQSGNKGKVRHNRHNNRLVAEDVIRLMKSGGKIVMKDVLAKRGYGPSVQKAPTEVTNSLGYKEVMGAYTKRLEEHRNKILAAMENADLESEDYRTLVDALSKVTHDHQLLTGGKTENVGVENDRQTLALILADLRGEKQLEPIKGEVLKVNGPESL